MMMSPARLTAAFLLLISVIATGLLVFQHFAGAAIPGCAPGGACAAAAESVWGRVPGTEIPVSLIGLAYYISLLVAYVVWRGQLGSLRCVVRLGVAASLLFTIVMFVNIGEYFCIYCLIGHAGHFGFWAIAEWNEPRTVVSMTGTPLNAGPAGLWAAGFVIAAAGLISANFAHSSALERAAERDLAESARLMAEADDDAGFVGRYVRGPLEAPIRIVVFTGYQCPECKRLEGELERILEQRGDVSLSVKHYPLNAECNPHAQTRMHRNACQAARAAEAAGILGGPEGFWKMHDWLFDRAGEFTISDLRHIVEDIGLDFGEFLEVWQSDETLRRIHSDADEGHSLGIFGTPLTFINGVELRGWHLPNAIPRAIERISEHGERLAGDAPQPAYEKYIEDWREARVVRPGPTTDGRRMGASQPRVTIDVWGDYHDEGVREFDAAVRRIMEERHDIAYTFRLFPMDQSCNQFAPVTLSEHGCRAARVGEAAARLYGPEGYAIFHEWLFANPGNFSNEALREGAAAMGFDPDELHEEMLLGDVTFAIARDAGEAQRLHVRMVPHILINGKWLPRWHLEGHDVLRDVIEEAAGQ